MDPSRIHMCNNILGNLFCFIHNKTGIHIISSQPVSVIYHPSLQVQFCHATVTVGCTMDRRVITVEYSTVSE